MKHRSRASKLKIRNRGASLVEYGTLASLVAVVSILTVTSFSDEVQSLFGTGSASLSEARTTAQFASGGGETPPSEEETAPPAMEITYSGGNATLALATPVDGATIDWGDGATQTLQAGAFRNVSHDYATDGTYTIQLTGDVSRIMFTPGVIGVATWGQVPIVSLESAFASASNLTSLPNWLPSSVTNLNAAFHSLSHPIDGPQSWDVSNVETMNSMFGFASEIPDLTAWGTVSADVSFLFANSNFDQDISGWDVSEAETLAYMFHNTPFNQDISSWDVSSVTLFSNMFWGADAFNQDISSWDVSAGESFHSMFRAADAFNQDISGWDVSQATEMMRMFAGAASFNQDLSGWCVATIASAPSQFDDNASAWTMPDSRPSWGSPC